jgi:L-ascorbate metabolism protein UlaG (beta-lactamase superfamily)
MTKSKIEVIKSLFPLELDTNECAFIFLGYSGILLRSKNSVIAIDPGRSLSQTEITAIEHFDLLFFTHNH